MKWYFTIETPYTEIKIFFLLTQKLAYFDRVSLIATCIETVYDIFVNQIILTCPRNSGINLFFFFFGKVENQIRMSNVGFFFLNFGAHPIFLS